MIGKLTGKIDSIYNDHTTIDVSGVGYLVFCSSKTLAKLTVGETNQVLIETHVREDHIHLYGFYNEEEKDSFKLLQSVKGVGTRMALAVLSTLTPEEIKLALATKNTAEFNKVPGVGKKLAERIITELKDKFTIDANKELEGLVITQIDDTAGNIHNDAITALTSLGVSRSDAQNRVAKLISQKKDINLNDIIKEALRQGV
ncbi:MAG: Holliday junction branch migration protein RuvA [Rickettsiaceae bacterium]|nr:Holliday junction branch migration protein RuvA [Rickettsiaceae bacterium]